MSSRVAWILWAGLGAWAGVTATRVYARTGPAPASAGVAAAVPAARISPDGKQLAFLAPSRGQLNVWVKGIDAPFSTARPLTADSARPIHDYRWSADGKYLLYLEELGPGGGVHLFAVGAAAGGSARDLTPYGAVQAQLVAVLTQAPGVAMVGLDDRVAGMHDLYRVDLGSGQRTLAMKVEEEVARWVVDRSGKPLFALRATGDSTAALLEVDGEYLAPFTHVCAVQRGCGPLGLSADGGRLYVVDAPGNADRTALYTYDLRTGRHSLFARDPHKRADFAGAVFSDGPDEVQLVYFREGDQLAYYPTSDLGRRDLRALRQEILHGDLDFVSRSADERWHVVTVAGAAPATYLYDRVHGHVTLLFRGLAGPAVQAQRAAPPGGNG